MVLMVLCAQVQNVSSHWKIRPFFTGFHGVLAVAKVALLADLLTHTTKIAVI